MKSANAPGKIPMLFNAVAYKLATRNVLAPLTLAVTVLCTFTILLSFMNHPLAGYAIGLTLLGFVAIGLAYFYWSKKDPDRLQSEHHVQNMTLLAAMRDDRGMLSTGENVAYIPKDAPTLLAQISDSSDDEEGTEK